MNARYAVVICIRGLAVLLIVAAFYFIAYGVVWWAFKSVSFADLLQILSHPILNLDGQLGVALPLVVLAGALWALQNPLARLIVPRAGKVCAECGYDLRKLKAAHCPECGAPAPKPATPTA